MNELERQRLLRQGAVLAKFTNGLPQKNVLPLKRSKSEPKHPGDLLDPIAEIQVLQMVLGWSKPKISQTLMTEYGVATRSRLTDADLIHYRRLLRVEVQKRRDAIAVIDRCVEGGAP